MKKIYSFLLACALTLVCGTAGAFQVTLQFDDVSRIDHIATYPAMDVTLDSEVVLEYADNAFMRMVYIYPAEDKWVTGYTIYDENDKVISTNTTVKNTMVNITVPAKADFGRIEVTTADELPADSKVKVTIVGDASKVKLANAKQQQLTVTEGEQIIEFNASAQGGTWYVLPNGVTKLYLVQLNGVTIETSDNYGAFQYNLRNIKDGDEIYIEVDFPKESVDFSLTITEGMEGAITGVYVNGELQDDWQSLTSVNLGDNIKVVTNTKLYKITSWIVNEVELCPAGYNWTEDWTRVVEGAMAIAVTAEAKEVYTVTFETSESWSRLENYADQGAAMAPGKSPVAKASAKLGYYILRDSGLNLLSLTTGEQTLQFTEDMMPLELMLFDASDNEIAATVTVNGETKASSVGIYKLHLQANDEVVIRLGVDDKGDGVKEVTSARGAGKGQTKLYDLSGRQANGSRIVIREGKKICE